MAGLLSVVDTAKSQIVNPGSGSNSASADSWVAGVHAGYNWQRGSVLYGAEADLQATQLKSSMTGGLQYAVPAFPPPGDLAATSSQVDWYGTVRGRLGWANGPLLLYATGGLAYGHVSLNSFFRTDGITLNLQASETKAGWVGGFGAEYLLQPNLILSLRYQYVDLGSLSVAGSSPPAGVTISQQATASAQFQTVMAGVSWRFAPGPASTPWQGGYAGIQGGGAWGNSTNAIYNSAITFSDVRLKRDITLLARRSDGLGVYAYRYLWSDAIHVGVMAQEVALAYPAAIVRDELTGLMAVNYSMLNAN